VKLMGTMLLGKGRGGLSLEAAGLRQPGLADGCRRI